MSSKKITYSSDFKLKVLDYYFKQGGDDKFGLKKKTAGHFNIDKKTINRMLNNPDMVKRARKLLTARKTTGSAKTAPATRNPVKAAVRRAGATQSRPSSSSNKSASSSQNSASSSSNNKASTSSTSSTKAGNSSSRQQASNTTSSSNKTASPKPKPGISKPGIPKPRIPENKSSPGVEVFDLPEDPDYSLLKRSISAATNGVASLAKLLVTGTEEVRNVVLNECDVILECKVCRNLFRSIVNFLAHKRIYCQEEFADVRTLFYKGDVQGVTSQSNTIVVEPEPPPENEKVNFMKTAIPTTHTSPMISVVEGRTRRSGIDSIALKLARKRKAYHASSSSTNTGSSSYFQSVSDVSSDRDKLSRDCSVVLEDIGGVKNAVFQTFVQPDSTLPSTSMSTLVEEASHSKSGMSVAINQNGDIVKTAAGDITSMEVDQPTISSESRDLTCLLCNTRFATQKTLSVHQRSHHGFERCIYACPICQASFLSMWAVVKHLQRTHKKTKNQIERLRKVVRKNVRKKMIYQKVEKNKTSEPLKNLDGEEEDDDNDNDVQEEVETPSASPSKASEVASPKKSSALSSPMQTSPVKVSSHKNDEPRSAGSPDHRCVKCDRKFSTPCALVSHDKFCSLMQMVPPDTSMNPLLRSETPEKKIAIQIRKDYKKPVSQFDLSAPNFSEGKSTQLMFKIPKTIQEKENQSKIEEMMGEFCDLSILSCIPCGRRYQTVTTLKRHAACHIDWTRFECTLCQYRNYHRYEVTNHCMSKHQVKEGIAASMVAEAEFVGQLKYFLENEESTPPSSNVDQDQPGEHCILTVPSMCDKNNDSSSPADDLENKPSLEVKGSCHLEKEMPLSNTGTDQNPLEENGVSLEDENSGECKVSQVKGENSGECKSSEIKDESSQECKGSKMKDENSEGKSSEMEDENSEGISSEMKFENSEGKSSEMKDENSEEGKGSEMKDESPQKGKDCEMKDENSEDESSEMKDESSQECKSCEMKDENSQKCKDSQMKDEHSEECKCSQKKDEISEECRATQIKGESFHHKSDENNISETHLNKPEEQKKKLEKNSDSKSLAEVQNPSNMSEKFTVNMRLHIEDSSESSLVKEDQEKSDDKMDIETVSNEDKDDRLCGQDIGNFCKVDSDSNSSNGAFLIKEVICIHESEVSKEIKISKTPDSSDKFLEIDNHELDTQDSYCSTDTTENASIPDNRYTEKLLDIDKHQIAVAMHNMEEEPVIEYDFKIEHIEKIKDVKENTSQDDDTDNTVVTYKMYDSESNSSCLETSEQVSVTECSVSANITEEDEILLSESESEFMDFKETERRSDGGRSEWRAGDESDDLLNDTKDLNLHALENPGLVDFCRFEGIQHPNLDTVFKIEKDIKPIPKDDLSLELKDFVGFPSTKDEIHERPHRMRRSIEQKDFIYDTKKPIFVKVESDDEDDCSILPTETSDCKLEGGRFGLRRRSSLLKSEVVAKKSKDEDEEEYKSESCNGSNFESAVSKKNENYSVSSKKVIDVDTSGGSSVERRKVRLVRRRLDTSPHGSVTLQVDGSKFKASEDCKDKNLENASESNGPDSKALVNKESLAMKRYSSRLKMASSPVPKKEKTQDISNVHILTNGQGQSNSVVTASKIKL